MGGIVNITTRAPTETSAFATLQGFAQPYRQYGTRDPYYGYAAETGFALKQAGSPWGLRLSLRRLDNTGQPQHFSLPGSSVECRVGKECLRTCSIWCTQTH